MSIENYIAQLKHFESADRARSEIIEIVDTVAKAMRQNPNSFHFSNLNGRLSP